MTANLTPAPDTGHAAEPMSDAQLIDVLVDAAVRASEARVAWRQGVGALSGFQERRRVLDQHRASVLRRLDSAPARTAGTETGGEHE